MALCGLTAATSGAAMSMTAMRKSSIAATVSGSRASMLPRRKAAGIMARCGSRPRQKQWPSERLREITASAKWKPACKPRCSAAGGRFGGVHGRFPRFGACCTLPRRGSIAVAAGGRLVCISPSMDRIEIIRPDDWHLHVRDGAMLKATLPASAAVFGRAIIMPNLVPPVRNTGRSPRLSRPHHGGAAGRPPVPAADDPLSHRRHRSRASSPRARRRANSPRSSSIPPAPPPIPPAASPTSPR